MTGSWWRLPGTVSRFALAVQAGRAEPRKGLPFVISFDPRFDTWNFSGVRFENSKEWQVVLTLYKIKTRESKATVRNELLQLKRGPWQRYTNYI